MSEQLLDWLEFLGMLAAAGVVLGAAVKVGRSMGRIETTVEHVAESVEHHSTVMVQGFERNDDKHDAIEQEVRSLATDHGERLTRLESTKPATKGGQPNGK